MLCRTDLLPRVRIFASDGPPPLPFEYLFSANGAGFTVSLGQRPRDSCHPRIASAESAIHSRASSVDYCPCRIESRFQRSLRGQSNPWDDVPGYG